MRRHIQKTRQSTWARRGFLPEEFYFLSEISVQGAKAPYIMAMRRRRSSLNANRVKYHWTITEYRRRVVADYQKMGLPKFIGGSYKQYIQRHFYDYFTEFKDKTPYDPTYESPKRKGRVRVRGEGKAQTGKRQMLSNRITMLNEQIGRASLRGDQKERRRLEAERNRYQIELDNLR